MTRLDPISINGNTIDPGAPAVQALGLGKGNAADSNYVLIQTEQVLNKAQKNDFSRLKIAIKERVGDSTYLCRFEPTDLEPIRALDFVKWVAVYPTNFVVSSKLKSAPTESVSSTMAVLSTHPHMVDVVFHEGHTKDADVLKNDVARAAHVDPNGLSGTDEKIRLTVQGRYLESVAQIDDVQSIVEVRQNKLFNNIARNILMGKGGVTDLNDVTVDGVVFRGQDQIIAVADTGVDSDHPAFGTRILTTFALGRPGKTDDTEGHGTHVCGSVLGNGVANGTDVIQGTAPEAQLVMQSVGDASGGLDGIPTNLNRLFQQAYDAGARIHSDSWGDVAAAQPYEQSATEIDQFVYSHPNFVICFAAGNDGIDRDRDGVTDLRQIGSQAAAKNCITVGASENLRPGLTLEYGYRGFATDSGALKFGASPIRFDTMADNIEGMAAFSSRGPTPERRVKPDVVAPGTGILSARSSKAHDSGLFGISTDPAWMYDAGTSMATPLVSGCAAVVRQAVLQKPPKNAGPDYEPSAALIKALLVNGAVDLAGQYHPSEAGTSPNYNSGWGRVNLAESVYTAMASTYVEGPPLDDDEFFDASVEITDKGATLKATLVWTDPPGPVLQNDLDLTVSVGRLTYTANAGLNRTNNVKQIIWPNIPKGTAKVHVSARSLTTGSQAFAVVWRVLE